MCVENYYLFNDANTTVCKEQRRVSGNLSAINNPKVFLLSFSETWPEYFSNFSAEVNISDLPKESYSCVTAGDPSKIQAYSISCKFSSNVTASSNISVKLQNLPPTNNSSFTVLTQKEYSLQLAELIICPDSGFEWDSGNKNK